MGRFHCKMRRGIITAFLFAGLFCAQARAQYANDYNRQMMINDMMWRNQMTMNGLMAQIQKDYSRSMKNMMDYNRSINFGNLNRIQQSQEQLIKRLHYETFHSPAYRVDDFDKLLSRNKDLLSDMDMAALYKISARLDASWQTRFNIYRMSIPERKAVPAPRTQSLSVRSAPESGTLHLLALQKLPDPSSKTMTQETDPEDLASVLKARASRAYDENLFFEAAIHYRSYLAMVPDDSTETYNLAMTCEALNMNQESVKAFQRYLELEPEAEDMDYVMKKIRDLSADQQ